MSRIGRRQLIAGATTFGLLHTATDAAAAPLPAPVVLVLERVSHRAEWTTVLATAFRTEIWAGSLEIRHLADTLTGISFNDATQALCIRQAGLPADRSSLWAPDERSPDQPSDED